jgi:hypothetical protein
LNDWINEAYEKIVNKEKERWVTLN